MKFQYYKDKKYFAQTCCNGNTAKLKDYEVFFDFRDPLIKRAEFNQNKRGYFPLLVQKYGKQCMLKISNDCTLTTNLVIDHFIPLSSNELNKKLRHLMPQPGKKVPTQSFGSNNLENLVISCSKCNSLKKHKLPTPELWQKVIQGQKGSLKSLPLNPMKKTPQNSMSAEQVNLVVEKVADFFCNLFRNHPEFLAEYAKQPHTHKRPK